MLVGASPSLEGAFESLNPFETATKTWAAIGLASSLFSFLFLLRAVQREDEDFWKAIGLAGLVGAGISVVGGAGKLFS